MVIQCFGVLCFPFKNFRFSLDTGEKIYFIFIFPKKQNKQRFPLYTNMFSWYTYACFFYLHLFTIVVNMIQIYLFTKSYT